MELKDVFKREASKTTTENGAVVFSTSGEKLTDFFAKIGNLRHDEREAIRVFKEAFNEDPITATRLLFYARDCRGGQGERISVFHIFYEFFCKEKPEYGVQLVKWFSEMGRWKDLWDIVGMMIKENGMEVMLDDTRADYPDVARYIFDEIMDQFNEDVMKAEAWRSGDLFERPNISMLGKWMPSCHSQSPNVRNLYKWFAKIAQGLTYCMGEKSYRYYTKLLRDHIDIVEHRIVSKEYYKIDYTKIPSRALKRYQTLFRKYDGERFDALMEKAANPEANPEVKLNVKQLYPYEILGEIDWWREEINDGCKATEADDALWYQMPNFFKRDVSILPVLDTSGSMCRPVINASIATSLAIYTAQRNSHETFKNYIMQFSDEPHLVSIEGKRRLVDIVNCFENDNNSTSFEGVMNYLLAIAINNKIPQEEMPEYLLIISDMQFNELANMEEYFNFNNKIFTPSDYAKIPMMQTIRERYETAGYKMPTMIYWNVDDEPKVKGQFPMEHRDGCIYISGKSPVIFEHLFDEKFPTTLDLIKKITESERYSQITLTL